MLLGFLVRDEESLSDLAARVKALPKAIFSIQEELPRWMRDDADDFGESGDEADPSLESFSESSYAEEGGSDDDDDDDEYAGSAANSIIERQTQDNEDSATQTGHDDFGARSVEPTGHQEFARRAIVPDIQISSSSRSNLVSQASPVPSQETLSQRSHRLHQPQSEMPSTPSGEGLGMVRSPRYRSDLRFPSSASSATARHSSNGSTARQPSDGFVTESGSSQAIQNRRDDSNSFDNDEATADGPHEGPSSRPASPQPASSQPGRAIQATTSTSEKRRPSVVAISSSWEEVAPDSMQARTTRESSVSQEWQDTAVEAAAETPTVASFSAQEVQSSYVADPQRTDTPWSVLAAMRYNNSSSSSRTEEQQRQAPQRPAQASATQIPHNQARTADREETPPPHSGEDIDHGWSPSSPSFDGLEAPSFPSRQ